MDAILIAINSKRTLHFLVRADVFDTPFKRWFFGRLNMMPIYRIRDGREALKNNDSIFLKCRKILENNGAIVIFPEGNCIVEKRLRAFKTGFVHLAFNSSLPNLQVMPVAINYSQPTEFNTDVSLSFLKPISVEEIKRSTGENEFDFNKLLMKKTHDALRQHMVYIPDETDDTFFESVLLMQRNSVVLTDIEFVSKQVKLSERLSQLKINNALKFENLKNRTEAYFELLKSERLTDEAIIAKQIPILKIILLFPFYISGFFLNSLPVVFLENIVNTKIREEQFKSSVRMVLSLFIYLIYILTVSALLNLAFQNYLLTLIIVLSLMYCYYHIFSDFNLFEKQKRKLTQQTQVDKLKETRGQIVSEFSL